MFRHPKDPRSWVEIDKNRIEKNYKEFRNLLDPKIKLGTVVKSNAYGHGIVKFSKLMSRLGTDWFFVDGIHEALHLRDKGIEKPILVLGHTDPEHFKKAEGKDISITIATQENIEALQKIKTSNLKIHLKINTGMNRQGILPDQAEKYLKSINKAQGTDLEGVYTHLADATTPESKETEKQLKNFERVLNFLEKNNLDPIKHAGATSGIVEFPKSRFDMARIGIGTYGLWPSKALKKKHSEKIKIKPALKWKSKLSEVKEIPEGEGIGYGFTETLSRNSKIAICPVGYWHGYPIYLSRKGRVLINGDEAKVLGRVMMDMIILDVTDIDNPKPGDEATLLGGKLHPDKMSKEAGTINYEIMTRINPIIKRVYL